MIESKAILLSAHVCREDGQLCVNVPVHNSPDHVRTKEKGLVLHTLSKDFGLLQGYWRERHDGFAALEWIAGVDPARLKSNKASRLLKRRKSEKRLC
jgi:hypothetical protein